MKQFQELAWSTSKGLGQLEGEYTIKLEDGVQPSALSTPCCVTILLMKAVKKELERMQEFGVIVPVTELTDCCSGMSAVPKE